MFFRPHVPATPRHRWLVRPLVAGLAAALVVTLGQVPPAAADPNWGALPAPDLGTPAQGRPGVVKPRPADPSRAAVLTAPPKVTWPVPATADVPVAARAGGDATPRVGGLPVAATPATGAHRSGGASVPDRVRVRVYERATSERAGVTGPVLRVGEHGGDGRTGLPGRPGPVRVAVGYGDFAAAYGGDYGARLGLVRLPECALTTPDVPACRTPVRLASVNDAATRTVTADVTDMAAGGVLLALEAEETSAQGSYAATTLSQSSSWSTNLSSGAFNWSYPVRTPPVPGSLAPDININYSSQAVDGRTSGTNNQGSWIGEGFSYEPGYVERRYRPCPDDGHKTVGDLCWARQNATIVLGGVASELVHVSGDVWKLAGDDGSRIERLTGATNGDNDGEHWKLTAIDGMQYFFGLNRLPGWSSGKEETESTWSVPVFGDDAGEPCHSSSGFADSDCRQAWRWNLDYVKDVRGNVVAYFYERETNHYARRAKTDVDGTSYHRAGYPQRIEYGLRDEQVYTTAAPARIRFDVTERCLPGGGVTCAVGDLTRNTAASWPDVPYDLHCAAETHCKLHQATPSFWTRKRLTGITTEIRTGSGWSSVDSWALTHSFMNNGDGSRTLWLSGLAQTGHRGDEPSTLPALEFVGIQKPNRIYDPGKPHIGRLHRYRLSTIHTESGGQVDIRYSTEQCVAGSLPEPDESTRRCFPVRWSPLGGEDRITDWFHKYVVEEVIETDRTGGNRDMSTRYEYHDGAGWRKVRPDGISKNEDLTWSDWRGYGRVTVRQGDGQTMHTRTVHTMLRGLDGDKDADGDTRDVSVSDSTGTTYRDTDEFSGHQLETVTYDGDKIVSKKINKPWLHVTHTQQEDWGSRRSTFVRTGTSRTLTALAPAADGTARWRETQAVTTHDQTWGRVTQVDDLGDVTRSDDDRCVRVWYADNAARRLHGLVSRLETVAVRCSATPNRSTQVLTDTRTSYDGLAHGAAPLYGGITRIEEITDHDGTTATYHTTSASTLDEYGRPRTQTDAVGAVTTTEHTQTHGLTTRSQTTNALGHRTIQDLDPAFGLPTRVEDPNGRHTDLRYDALGRLTDVWLPDRSRTAGQTPNLRYAYTMRKNATTVVKSEKVRNDGSYHVSYELFDGWLRSRQIQHPGPDGGWLVSDTRYTGTGEVEWKTAPYFVVGTAGDLPIIVPDGTFNGQTTFRYDGADRVIAEIFSVAGDQKWQSTTRYEGDRTHLEPPTGGIRSTTVTDARDNTTEVHQYTAPAPATTAQVTRYGYTPAGSLATVTDPAGAVWRYRYDQRHRKIEAQDPDSGTSTFGYDDAGRPTSVTDAHGQTLSHTYDLLGRKRTTWLGAPTTGSKLAEWSYDGLAKGQLHWSARYDGTAVYGTTYSDLDPLYRPRRTSHTIPAAAGAGLAGTYHFTTVYNVDGTVQSVGMPAGGGLPAEAVVTSYDELLRPTALTGATPYVTGTSYQRTGELLGIKLATAPTHPSVTRNWNYERGTGRVVTARLERSGAPTVDALSTYRYDHAGNVLSIADAAGQRDVQCFRYDALRRMTEAWATDITDAEQCADGAAATGVGGVAPYHESWTFDAAGNRQTETLHGVGGAADTERVYRYPAPGAAQPHTLTRVDESGPAGNRTYSYGYDAVGNTTSRNLAGAQQTLTWAPEGQVASVTAAGGTTTFVYDAEGARLTRKEPGATTVYLPGMELRRDHTTGTVVGTRFYTFADKVVATRTGGQVHFEVGDHHGTSTASVDAASGAISWRRTTSYGGPRGAQATTWPHQKGFVGGTQDPTTGLTNLGARQYDPAIGRFISVDPLIRHDDPQQMQGYVYSNHNPVTFSDPTGRDWLDNLVDVLEAANNTTTYVGIGMMVLGAAINTGGGALAVTGVGVVAGAPALAFGTKLMIAGGVTAAAGIVGGNAAAGNFDRQSSGSGSGSTGGTSGSNSRPHRNEARELVDEHHGRDNGAPLTEDNAFAALQGPAGTTPRIVPRGPQRTADIEFVDNVGNVVSRTEVKTFGNPAGSNFGRQFKSALEQIDNNGTVFVQVPRAAQPQAWLSKWQHSHRANLSQYRKVTVRFYDDTNKHRGDFRLNEPVPRPDPPVVWRPGRPSGI